MVSASYIKVARETLRLVRKKLGHTELGNRYKIPNTPDWPVKYHNFNFGKLLMRLRLKYAANKLTASQIEELEKDKMVWDIYEHKFKLYVDALVQYRKLHGNMLVPIYYVVPVDDKDWPEEYWGMKLGLKVHNFRTTKSKLKQHRVDLLNEVGFAWAPYEHQFDTIYLPGLKWFKKEFGHIAVPLDYCIPVDDERVPLKLRGIKLRSWINRLNTNQVANKKQIGQLKEIGYNFKPLIYQTFYEEFVKALKKHYDLHGNFIMFKNYKMEDGYPLGDKFYGLVREDRFYHFYDKNDMEPLGLYRHITDEMFENVVKDEIDKFRVDNPNKKIKFSTSGSTIHLGYLKYHCKHTDFLAYLKKYNL